MENIYFYNIKISLGPFIIYWNHQVPRISNNQTFSQYFCDTLTHFANKTFSSNLLSSIFLKFFMKSSKVRAPSLNFVSNSFAQSYLAFMLEIKSKICSERSSLGLTKLVKLSEGWLFSFAERKLFISTFSLRKKLSSDWIE